MRTKFLKVILCGTIAWFGAFTSLRPAAAHHAFGSEFDANAPVLLKGKIAKIEWVNPHTWIHVEITKEDGTKEVWRAEARTPFCGGAQIRTRFRWEPTSSSTATRRAIIPRSERTRAMSRSPTG